jgi:hypothetical protein
VEVSTGRIHKLNSSNWKKVDSFHLVVYYETKVEESNHLSDTGVFVELEHLKIEE